MLRLCGYLAAAHLCASPVAGGRWTGSARSCSDSCTYRSSHILGAATLLNLLIHRAALHPRPAVQACLLPCMADGFLRLDGALEARVMHRLWAMSEEKAVEAVQAFHWHMARAVAAPGSHPDPRGLLVQLMDEVEA